MKRKMKRLAVCLLAVALFCSGCGQSRQDGEVTFAFVGRDGSRKEVVIVVTKASKQSLSEVLVDNELVLWEETESGQRVTTVNREYADAAASEYWSATKNGAVFAGPWEQVEAVDGDVYELVFSIRL